MAEFKAPIANSWDLDGIIIGREGISNKFSAWKGKLKPSSNLPLSFKDVPPIIRNIAEAISFSASSRRKVLPEAVKALELAKRDGIDNYGNTGRLDKKKWRVITESTLEAGKARDLLKKIFYTDPGLSTVVSKAEAIRELRQSYLRVRHIDDDPKTAFYLASKFPDMTVYLVQYGRKGLLYSKTETDKFPNLKRITKLQEISRD